MSAALDRLKQQNEPEQSQQQLGSPETMELLTSILAAVEAQNTRIATLTEQQRKLAGFVKVMDEETPRRLERITAPASTSSPSSDVSTRIASIESRQNEIAENLPTMLDVARRFPTLRPVVAGAPGLTMDDYRRSLGRRDALPEIVFDRTYELLAHAHVALVTSGTATLEAALFRVPQVVCYAVGGGRLANYVFDHFFRVPYISLVNLIADREIVQELLADRFSIRNIANELYRILPGQTARECMLADYQLVRQRLGNEIAPDNAARIMVEKLISSHANQYVNRQINESTNEQVCELVSEQYETLTHEHTDHNGEVLIGES